jgi:DNA-binding beta-propeller fold protein YncE
MLATKLRAATAGAVAWDVSYAYYDPPEGLAGNLGTADALRLYDVGVQETSPQSVFFKPDGTKMYVLGGTRDDVNEYDLSIAWDVGSASYLQNFSVAAQDTSPTGLFFKPDGLKMYVLGDAGNDVNEYTLSTAWNISTASYLQNFVVGAQEQDPSGLFFKPDGTKMYILGTQGVDVNEYDLSTAWDISTASYLVRFFVGNQENFPRGLFFKPDGKAMYVLGTATDSVYEYTISIQP